MLVFIRLFSIVNLTMMEIYLQIVISNILIEQMTYILSSVDIIK